MLMDISFLSYVYEHYSVSKPHGSVKKCVLQHSGCLIMYVKDSSVCTITGIHTVQLRSQGLIPGRARQS
jgi:hypothetical protein